MRVVLNCSLSSVVLRIHYYLWISKIRFLETYLFTIMNNITTSLSFSLKFVIAVYNSFTSDLYEYALKNLGILLWTLMDSSYSIPVNFGIVVDKAVFLSGESGASYTFRITLNIIKKILISGITRSSIDFVWIVEKTD